MSISKHLRSKFYFPQKFVTIPNPTFRREERGKNIGNTIDGIEYTFVSSRRSGNTTRQVDAAIQDLFAGIKLNVIDHHENGKNRMANDRLMKLILGRLQFEHRMRKEYVIVDFNSNTIQLKINGGIGSAEASQTA